jgi:transposase-like protein
MMRKHYTPSFKAQVVRELLKEDKALAQLAAEHGVQPTQLITWRAIALEGLPSWPPSRTAPRRSPPTMKHDSRPCMRRLAA